MPRRNDNVRERKFRVRFKEIGVGRDGGNGHVKSCHNTKLHKHAQIISVREIKEAR